MLFSSLFSFVSFLDGIEGQVSIAILFKITKNRPMLARLDSFQDVLCPILSHSDMKFKNQTKKILIKSLLFVALVNAPLFSYALSLTMTRGSQNEVSDEAGNTVGKKQELLPIEVLQISPEPHLNTNFLLTDKTERKMYVFKNSEDKKTLVQVQVFNIDIGKNNGPKTKRDDKKTPEGIYRLEKKLLPPEIPFDQYGVMAFTTDYPNVFDKFENKSGSGIWLHSVPDDVPLTRGSRGCVVIRNDDIKQADPLIQLNRTFMIINDKINWVTRNEHDTEHAKALAWINQWKDQWANQNIDEYIKLYSEKFTAPGFNKKSWYKHKTKLKNRYKYSKVTLSEPNIFKIKDQYLFQVIQDYESDGYADHGVKNLYVKEEDGVMKILREEWFEVKR